MGIRLNVAATCRGYSSLYEPIDIAQGLGILERARMHLCGHRVVGTSGYGIHVSFRCTMSDVMDNTNRTFGADGALKPHDLRKCLSATMDDHRKIQRSDDPQMLTVLASFKMGVRVLSQWIWFRYG